jgi:hypothetical protein
VREERLEQHVKRARSVRESEIAHPTINREYSSTNNVTHGRRGRCARGASSSIDSSL